MRILFVCTGNSCRSPMAELYFDELCRRNGRHDITACSAGIYAWDGVPISRPASAVMSSLGIDPSLFRSTRFTPELARECDLLVAMAENHRQAMEEIAPSEAGKISLLLDYSDGGDVPDPYGGSETHYRRVFDSMRPALDALFQFVTR